MIILIWSSPNKDGLTATAKNKIIEGLSAVDPEIEDLAEERLVRSGRCKKVDNVKRRQYTNPKDLSAGL